MSPILYWTSIPGLQMTGGINELPILLRHLHPQRLGPVALLAATEGNFGMNKFPLEETDYGFRWGPVAVERVLSDPKFGVLLSLATRKHKIELRVTPGGRILIYKWGE